MAPSIALQKVALDSELTLTETIHSDTSSTLGSDSGYEMVNTDDLASTTGPGQAHLEGAVTTHHNATDQAHLDGADSTQSNSNDRAHIVPGPGHLAVIQSPEHATTSDAASVHSDQLDLLAYEPYITDEHLAVLERTTNLDRDRTVSYADGEELLKILKKGTFDGVPNFCRRFKTMINMIKHMNVFMFTKDRAKPEIGGWALGQIDGLSTEIVRCISHYCKNLDVSLLDKLEEVKANLPTLDDTIEGHLIRPTIRIWRANINGALPSPNKHEERLFNGFVEFYDAMIYHPFLQTRIKNPEHEMCKFADRFAAIQAGLEGLCQRTDDYRQEFAKFKTVVQAAYRRLLSDPEIYMKEYKIEMAYKRAAELSGPPSSPQDAETSVEPGDNAAGGSSGAEMDPASDDDYQSMVQSLREEFGVSKEVGTEDGNATGESDT